MTSSQLPFYRAIGSAFDDELLRLLTKGGHAALLGSRGSGKSLVLDRIKALAELRPAVDRPKIVQLFRDPKVGWQSNEQIIQECLAEPLGVRRFGHDELSIAGRVERVLREASAASDTPVWLLVKDILDFPGPLARGILRALHACHEETAMRKKFAAVVSGEADFIPLTYGSQSPYRHAVRFLVAQLDEPSAMAFFLRRRQNRRSGSTGDAELVAEELEGFRHLYAQTGGSPHLIQEVVAGASRFPHPLGDEKCWTLVAAQRCVDAFLDHFMASDHLSLSTMHEVERDPRSFATLLDVFEKGDGKVRVGGTPGQPLELEVWGLVRRDTNFLASIACPIWRGYLARIADKRRIAGTFARQQNWPEAWKRYDTLPENLRDRPIAGVARERLRGVLQAWGESLINSAALGTDAVCEQFFRGARHLLGLDHAALINVAASPPAVLAQGFGAPNIDAWRAASHQRGFKRQQFADDRRFWLDSDRRLMFSDPGNDEIPSKKHAHPVLVLAREDADRLMDTLDQANILEALTSFWRGYLTAEQIEYRKRIGEVRDRHLKVVEHVNSLIDEEHDLERIVQGAADALVDIGGYFRIQICLVDPQGESVQAVAHRCRDPERDFNYPTSIPLTDDTPPDAWDIQRWVVIHKAAKSLPDATDPTLRNPTTQADPAAQLGMRGIAVVPMIVQGDVLGTIHFERTDRVEPPEYERRMFEALAAQLGIALHLAQRLNLLEKSLMRLTDRIWILDPLGRTVFMNEAATQTSGRRSGFQTREEQQGIERWRLSDANVSSEKLRLMAMSEMPMHEYVVAQTSPNVTAALDLLSAALVDFRHTLKDRRSHLAANGVIGSVHRLHDLTVLYELYDALQSWLADTDLKVTAEKILEFFRKKNYAWCRLYILEREGGTDVLKSLAQFGLKDLKNQEAFARGRMRFSRTTDPLPWHVLETRTNEPAIYRYDPNAMIDQVPCVASDVEGKPCFVTNDSRYRDRLEKQDTEWIQAPLRLGSEEVGIVTLSLPRPMPPRDWELLKSALVAMSLALYNAQRTQSMKALVSKKNHNIKTLLGWIQHNAENLFQESPQDDPRGATAANILQYSTELRLEVVELIDFGSMRAGLQSHNIGPFDVYAMLNGLCDRFRGVIGHRPIKLPKCLIGDEVPRIIVADSTRLRRVLVSLLENAINYTEQGSVSIGARASDTTLTISVADTGEGIAAESHGEIFELFERADAARSARHGWGIGLATCREEARAMGGDVTLVRSAPGQGSEFAVHFPFTKADNQDAAETRTRRIPRRILGDRRCHILIVDDQAESRRLLRKALERIGCTVVEAENGETAIDRVQVHQFDLIFMDFNLTGIDGRETTRQIVARVSPAPKIVALTAARGIWGEDDVRAVEERARDGFVDLVQQPADLLDITEQLTKHVGVEIEYAELPLPQSILHHRAVLTKRNLSGAPRKVLEAIRLAATELNEEDAATHAEALRKSHPILADAIAALIEESDLDFVGKTLETELTQ